MGDIYRGNRSGVFYGTAVLKKFAKFIRKGCWKIYRKKNFTIKK